MTFFYFSRRTAVSSFLSAGFLATRPSLAAEAALTMDVFRDEVLALGRRDFPDMGLKAGPSETQVIAGPHTLSLGSIFQDARYLSPSSREAMIEDWLRRFTPAADARASSIRADSADWAKAKPLLRPKLMGSPTASVLDRLVVRPFVGGLFIAYAIDLGDKDLYVSKDLAAKWPVQQEAIEGAAIANLEDMSQSLASEPGTATDKKGAVLDIRTGDGYDAARLLLPGLRSRLLTVLGTPFHAAVPARDAFLCWTKGDANAERLMVNLVREESAAQSHAISLAVFEVDGSGVRLA